MAIDYEAAARMAQRLVTENGRVFNFVKEGRSSDPRKPWLGDSKTESLETSRELSGIRLPPNTVRQFGITSLGEGTEFANLMAFSEQIIIVYPEDADIKQFTHVEDEIRWGITAVQVLKPTDVQLLAYVGVRR